MWPLGGGLTPFVGRAVELALLQERWQQAQEELGQVVEVHTPIRIITRKVKKLLFPCHNV
jgi:hypothetical protein